MNHKSISNVVKRGLTFLLAFAMIATSLYVAPAASAEELDGDEVILDESSEEIIEEEIIGEGEATEGDAFTHDPTQDDDAGDEGSFALLFADGKKADDFALDMDEPSKMAGAVVGLVYNENHINSTLLVLEKYGEGAVGENDVVNEVGVPDAMSSDPITVLYIDSITLQGGTTVAIDHTKTLSEELTAALTGAEAGKTVAIGLGAYKVPVDLGKAGTPESLAKLDIVAPVVWGEGAIRIKPGDKKMTIPTKGGSSISADLAAELKSSSTAANKITVQTAASGSVSGADADWADVSSPEWSDDAAGGKYTLTFTSVKKSGNSVAVTENVTDAIDQLPAGATAVVGYKVTTGTNVSLAAAATGTVELTVEKATESGHRTLTIESGAPATITDIDRDAAATMKTKIEEGLAKIAGGDGFAKTSTMNIKVWEGTGSAAATTGVARIVYPVKSDNESASNIDDEIKSAGVIYMLSVEKVDGEAPATGLAKLDSKKNTATVLYKISEYKIEDSGGLKMTGEDTSKCTPVYGTATVTIKTGGSALNTVTNPSNPAKIKLQNNDSAGKTAMYDALKAELEKITVKVGSAAAVKVVEAKCEGEDAVEDNKGKQAVIITDIYKTSEGAGGDPVNVATGVQTALVGYSAGDKITVEYKVVTLEAADGAIPTDGTDYDKVAGSIELEIAEADGAVTVTPATGLRVTVSKSSNIVNDVAAKIVKDGKISVTVSGNDKIKNATVVESATKMTGAGLYWLVVPNNDDSVLTGADPGNIGIGKDTTFKVVLYKGGTSPSYADADGNETGSETVKSGNIDVSVRVLPQAGTIKSVEMSKDIAMAAEPIDQENALKALKDHVKKNLKIKVFDKDGKVVDAPAANVIYNLDPTQLHTTPAPVKDTTYYYYSITKIGASTSGEDAIKTKLASTGSDLAIKVLVTPVVTKEESSNVVIGTTLTAADNDDDAPDKVDQGVLDLYAKYAITTTKESTDRIINLPVNSTPAQLKAALATSVKSWTKVEANQPVYNSNGGNCFWSLDGVDDTAMEAKTPGEDVVIWLISVDNTPTATSTETDKTEKYREKYTGKLTITATSYKGNADNDASVAASVSAVDKIGTKFTLNIIPDGNLESAELAKRLTDNGLTVPEGTTLDEIYETIKNDITVKEMKSGAPAAATGNLIDATAFGKLTADDKKGKTYLVYTIALDDELTAGKNPTATVAIKKYVYKEDGAEDDTKGSGSEISAAGSFEIAVVGKDGTIVDSSEEVATTYYTSPSDMLTTMVNPLLNKKYNVMMKGNIVESAITGTEAPAADGLSEGQFALINTGVTVGGAAYDASKADDIKAIEAAIQSAYEGGSTVAVAITLQSWGYDKTDKAAKQIGTDFTYTVTYTIMDRDVYDVTLTVYDSANLDESKAYHRIGGTVARGKVITKKLVEDNPVIKPYVDQITEWYDEETGKVWDLDNTPVNKDVDLYALRLGVGVSKPLADSADVKYATNGVANAVYNNKAYKPVPLIKKIANKTSEDLTSKQISCTYYEQNADGTRGKKTTPKNAGKYIVVVTDKTAKPKAEVMECKFEIEKLQTIGELALAGKIANFKEGKPTKVAALKSYKYGKLTLKYDADYSYKVYDSEGTEVTSTVLDAKTGNMNFTKADIYTVSISIKATSTNYAEDTNVAGFNVNVADAAHQLKSVVIKKGAVPVVSDNIADNYMSFTFTPKGGKTYTVNDMGAVYYTDDYGIVQVSNDFVVNYVQPKTNALTYMMVPGKVDVTISAVPGNDLKMAGFKTFSYSIKADSKKKLAKGKYSDTTINLKGHDKAKDIIYTGTEWTLEDIIMSTKHADPSDTTGKTMINYTKAEAIDMINKAVSDAVYNKDFTIEYSNNINAGTATANFVSLPDSAWTGSFKMTFKIQKVDLSKKNHKAEIDDTENPGSKKSNGLPIFVDEKGLGYADPATNATKWVLAGKEKDVVEINPAALAAPLVANDKLVDATDALDANNQPKYKEVGGLVAGRDYTISYKDNKTTGKAADKEVQVTIKGAGKNYTGSYTFKVARKAAPATTTAGN